MLHFSKESGFTIFETLIVLAVVGVLAVSIIISMSGRITNARRMDGISQLESQLRILAQDVSNGSYSSGAISCGQAGGVFFANNSGPGSSFGQGGTTSSNYDCVYAGKQLTFHDTYYTVDTMATAEGAGITSLTPSTTPVVSGDQVKRAYPGSMNLKNAPAPFYIFNANNYNTSTLPTFTTGQQKVVFTNSISNPPSMLPSSIIACFYNSNVLSSISINPNNTIETKLIDSSC
jgi:prepilin-type N-terminal cleavage/methylation domain-containing protein